MVMMSQAQLQREMRSLEIPNAQCVTEALNRIEELCTLCGGRCPSFSHEKDRVKQIMAEFIFCEVDSRRFPREKLSEIQQLIVLTAMCNYFGYTKRSNQPVRNAVFMSLFSPKRTARMRFLFPLVSMAVTQKNIPVLTATGIWMQQLGCMSKWSVDLVQYLVRDFFSLEPAALASWKTLPQRAPHFTANVLTTIAEIYKCDERRVFVAPPDAMLEIVTEWVSENPSLCLAAVKVDLKPAMPIGAIPMTPITPFAGLFRWCLTAPIHYAKSNAKNLEDSDPALLERRIRLYSHLQLVLLTSLLECRTIPSGNNTLSAKHLGAISEPIMWFIQRMQSESSEGDDTALNMAIHRFGQAVQVALAVKCIYGNHGEFLEPMMKLRHNRFIRLVLRAQGIVA